MRMRCVLALALALIYWVSAAAQSGFSRIDRQRAQQMLASIKTEIQKNYYDPEFRGINLDEHFKAAHGRLEQAASLGHAMGIVAQALLDFDDSHTFFVPPNRTTRVEYGWQTRMIGDDCYIVAVRPGSDAEKKGLKPGTRILAIEGRKPTRNILWKIEYHFYSLSPRPALKVAVQQPGQAPREVEVLAKVTQGKRVLDLAGEDSIDLDAMIREAERHETRHRWVRYGTLVIWQMPAFDFLPDEMERVASDALKGADSLVLDMRGNPGGLVVTLEKLTGRFFDRELKIADLRGRRSMKPIVAKKHNRPFAGKIVAIVDSRSGSAAELLARVLQLEKRGTVIGDRTSGSVMQSYGFSGRMGADVLVFYGASITNADVIMADGKSLEKTGVTPDELVLPTVDDLTSDRDPVLARAAAILGVTIDPKEAKAQFPVEWR